MKLENFKQCAEIVDKIKQLQKIIDNISESESVSFINSNYYPLFSINLNSPDQSQTIFENSLAFKKIIVNCLDSEVKILTAQLESL